MSVESLDGRSVVTAVGSGRHGVAFTVFGDGSCTLMTFHLKCLNAIVSFYLIGSHQQ